MSILTIDHISKYYNLDGTNQEHALNDVTLEIVPAKITAIYGPSGCGKTSLLSIISGLDSQYQGNLYFKNQNMRDFSERDLTYFRKERPILALSFKISILSLINQSLKMSRCLFTLKI